jgi:hypothetical protein
MDSLVSLKPSDKSLLFEKEQSRIEVKAMTSEQESFVFEKAKNMSHDYSPKS